MRRGWRAGLLTGVVVLACGAPASASPPILSAFFGVDNGLPVPATFLCPPAVILDGLPVVFRNEIDQRTLWPWDFTVTTRSGRRMVPWCATTAPANEESEDRTVLLIGQLGDEPSDPPVRVDVTGALLDESGHSLLGATSPVVPLAAGPSLVYAETAPPEPDTYTYPPLALNISLLQRTTACPPATVLRVRVTWQGGVTAPAGGDGTEPQRFAYKVTMADGRVITPAAIADTGDMDNNHLLCLGTTGTPVSVSADAGWFKDPRGDVNAATSVAVDATG